MNRRDDIQMLIPETHRDLIEALPRGFPRSAVTAALLMGAIVGAPWTFIVPPWAAGAIGAVLVVGHLIYKHTSDKAFDDRMSALQTRGMDWKGDDNS